MADAKRIAKNTLYMYIRMILVMGVTIYTSRVILDKLGIDDYGLYNAVASVVGVMTFLNSTLSTSTSRFLTYDLGIGNFEKLRRTFSTSFYAHLILAGIIIISMETIGLWYLSNKFVIPEGRDLATHIVFQISIVNTALLVIQVPLTATITAHEDMRIYAWMSIVDVSLKLFIVYLLSISPIDKMVFYASLLLVVHLLIFVVYLAICHKRYSETHLTSQFSKDTFKEMVGFTGWTTVANFANSFIVQGSVLLLNLFFAPAIVATKALANQVTQAIMQFVTNFRVAMNPQIIKSYASGDSDESKRLTLISTVISFDLMLIIGLPLIFTMDAVLKLWLVEVPPQATLFTQLAIISQILATISTSTYVAFIASAKQKLNSLWGLVTGGGYFVILYFIYKLGGDAVWVQYLYIVNVLIGVLVLRPYLLHREMGYGYKEFFVCVWNCTKVLLSSIMLSFGISLMFGPELWQQIILFGCVMLISTMCSYLFLEKSIRKYALNMIKNKIHRSR